MKWRPRNLLETEMLEIDLIFCQITRKTAMLISNNLWCYLMALTLFCVKNWERIFQICQFFAPSSLRVCHHNGIIYYNLWWTQAPSLAIWFFFTLNFVFITWVFITQENLSTFHDWIIEYFSRICNDFPFKMNIYLTKIFVTFCVPAASFYFEIAK